MPISEEIESQEDQSWWKQFEPFDPDAEESREEREEEIEESESQAQEGRTIRVMKNPKEPTQAEVDQHNVSHCPFRSWCKVCVMGQSVTKGHFKRREDEESQVPTVSLDYMFMTEGSEQEKEEKGGMESGMPILVILDHETDMCFAAVVPEKGVHAYAVIRASNDIALTGHTSLILKSDNEPAIMALKNAVKAESSQQITTTAVAARRQRSSKMIGEESAAYDSASNGKVEAAIRWIQGHIRTMKAALESRLQTHVDDNHDCLPWLIRHSSWIRNRMAVKSDGKTAYERWKGKIQERVGRIWRTDHVLEA